MHRLSLASIICPANTVNEEVQLATYRCDKEIFNYNERSLDEFAYLRSEQPHAQT